MEFINAIEANKRSIANKQMLDDENITFLFEKGIYPAIEKGLCKCEIICDDVKKYKFAIERLRKMGYLVSHYDETCHHHHDVYHHYNETCHEEDNKITIRW